VLLSLSPAWVGSGLGCTDDAVSGDDEVSGETSDEDTDEGSDEGMISDGIPARGIELLEVEANQGTAVLIGKDGEWVGGDGRNAFMIRDRDTLIRLQHKVTPGWVPREIEGVLHLRTADGEDLPNRRRQFMVEEDSDPLSISSSFYFSILADEAQPGLTYWVELLEVDDGTLAGDAVEGLTTTPSDFELVGYETTALEIKVMLVPIEYTYFDTPTLVEPNEADLQLLHDELLQQNPLQTVTFELHEPYVYDNHLTNLGALLGPMAALRGNENADPNVYYHALVDVNGPAVNMVAGIAQLAGSGKSGGMSRVAATVWDKYNGNPPAGSAGTFVHEVGHNQGLPHVFCPGAATEAAGPDPNYPHEGGTIGVFGFGIRSFKLYTPEGAHDYMTYCGNSWVSDWTFNKTYKRIRELTSWDYEGPSAEATPNVPLMVGTLFADGSEDWWVMMGPEPEQDSLSAEQRLVYMGAGGDTNEVLTQVSTLSDGLTTLVVAPLTVPLDQLESAARIDWRERDYEVPLEGLHVAAGLQISR